MNDLTTFFSGKHTAPWQERLAFVLEMMKDISTQTDPQALVAVYGRYMNAVMPADRTLSLSRRGLTDGAVHITRSSTWAADINPWRQPDQLPLLRSGLLSEVIYRDRVTILNDLRVDPADPAYEYLEGMGSLIALPLFDRGEALNMVVSMRRARDAFDFETLPENVWVANLFGRATHNLVLSDEVRRAYDAVDRELRTVASVQYSLLPESLPALQTLDLATHYVTSRWAGGDYYDFFPIDATRCGILIADVSGHRTPAAVFMTATHALAHAAPNKSDPAEFLRYVNEGLCKRYTRNTGRFVTAFYGVYDDTTRTLTYANAGHPGPRVRRTDGVIFELDGNRSIPLGILDDETFAENTCTLQRGDVVVLFTDGVTETRNAADDLFGTERLDAILTTAGSNPQHVLSAILEGMNAFKGSIPQQDDVTLLAATVR